jgi:RNase adapter protein RapZ
MTGTMTNSTQAPQLMKLVLLSGMSGSGKSVALRALEDAGYYCVDNLPPELLLDFVKVEQAHKAQRVAVAIDSRSASSLPNLPKQLDALRAAGTQARMVFFDASTDTLIRRFSETRRRHPLSADEADQRRALTKAIELERELLEPIRTLSHVIDSSVLRASQLQSAVKALAEAPSATLTLVFESFAFKHGIPLDADYVFDVRMLPNPHYERELRQLTGMDAPVATYLADKPEVARMERHITGFLQAWLPELAKNHRSYVTVAIGCTGGQHRSVYLVEKLTQTFAQDWTTVKRHRELAVQDFNATRY